MTRPTQHVIDTQGQKLFRGSIPDEWTIDQPETGHDYGRDFFVRVFEAGEETKYEFRVQLKSVRNPVVRRNCISFSLRVSNLKRFLNNDVLPVYLVIADLANRRCFYECVQEYASSGNLPKKWKSQRTVTIRVPTKNSLDDSCTFTEHVKKQFDLLQSPQASLKRLRGELEQKDSRVHITRLIADEHGTHATLSPAESFQCRLSFSPQTAGADKIDDLNRRGRATTFRASDIQLTGSPHFNELKDDDDVTIQFARKAPARATYFAVDDAGARRASFQYSGHIEMADEEIRCYGQTEEGAYTVQIRTSLNQSGSSVAEHTFGWDLTPYEGQDVRTLPYIEDFDDFVSDVLQYKMVGFELIVSGNKLGGNDGVASDIVSSIESYGCLSSFWRAVRTAARYFNINFSYTPNFESSDVKSADFLALLAAESSDGEGKTISGSMKAHELIYAIESGDFSDELKGVEVCTSGEVLCLLSKDIALGTYRVRLSSAKLTRPAASLLADAKERGSGDVRVKFAYIGAKGSTISIGWEGEKILRVSDVQSV